MSALKSRLKAALAESRIPFVRRAFRGLQDRRRQGRAAKLQRAVRKGVITFVTLDEAVNWTREWLPTLPKDIDLVVGIPRSGLLFADMIALSLAKPLATPETLAEGGPWVSERFTVPEQIASVLLVDDSVDTGESMADAVDEVRNALPGARVTTAVLIGRKEQKASVDHIFRMIPQPRLFEWDLMHQKKVGHVAVVLEGVIAPARPTDLPDTEYAKWLDDTGPGRIPIYLVDTVIAYGPEGAEGSVATYLDRHGVDFGRILMAGDGWPDAVKSTGAELVFTADDTQAACVWEDSGIAAIAFDTMTLYAA